MPETVQESGADGVEEPTPKERASPTRGSQNGEAERGASSEDLLVREGDIAGDYLEQLLDLVDYDGDIDLDVEAGRAIVSIDGGEDLEKLVGPRGNVLESLQELTRLAVQQETGTRSRLMLDIAGWRADRREELADLGRATAERVLAEGEKIRLQPMTPVRAQGRARRGRRGRRRPQRERGRGPATPGRGLPPVRSSARVRESRDEQSSGDGCDNSGLSGDNLARLRRCSSLNCSPPSASSGADRTPRGRPALGSTHPQLGRRR